jgi:hypothetical protein
MHARIYFNALTYLRPNLAKYPIAYAHLIAYAHPIIYRQLPCLSACLRQLHLTYLRNLLSLAYA